MFIKVKWYRKFDFDFHMIAIDRCSSCFCKIATWITRISMWWVWHCALWVPSVRLKWDATLRVRWRSWSKVQTLTWRRKHYCAPSVWSARCPICLRCSFRQPAISSLTRIMACYSAPLCSSLRCVNVRLTPSFTSERYLQFVCAFSSSFFAASSHGCHSFFPNRLWFCALTHYSFVLCPYYVIHL